MTPQSTACRRGERASFSKGTIFFRDNGIIEVILRQRQFLDVDEVFWISQFYETIIPVHITTVVVAKKHRVHLTLIDQSFQHAVVPLSGGQVKGREAVVISQCHIAAMMELNEKQKKSTQKVLNGHFSICSIYVPRAHILLWHVSLGLRWRHHGKSDQEYMYLTEHSCATYDMSRAVLTTSENTSDEQKEMH